MIAGKQTCKMVVKTAKKYCFLKWAEFLANLSRMKRQTGAHKAFRIRIRRMWTMNDTEGTYKC
jgi:hypothetical protein